MSKSTFGIPGFESLSSDDEEGYRSKDSRFRNNKKICRVAAVDIGTNSTHLVIASVDPTLNTFSIDLAEKSSTRLGDRDEHTGDLTEFSKNKVIETLKRFKELALSYKVDEILLAATSAVREAPNGRDFLIQIRTELGLAVELISGPEEARLIYLGVLSGMNFQNSPHFLLDIGGGSTELILADGKDARALTSTKIGAVSLQRDFIRDEPMSEERVDFLRVFIQGSLEPAIKKVSSRVKPGEKVKLVATSGTALAVGALAALEEQDLFLKKHGYKFGKQRLNKLIEKLLKLSPNERRKLPSLSDRRSEIIVPGALIMQMAMQMLQVEDVVLSERALREGMVVNWMISKGLLKDRFSFQGSIRKRTVIHQVERFSVNRQHSERVASTALAIYDNTYGALHNDKGSGRDLLWAAAMLHSCGQHINLASYHKHSWYLIKHGELLGYSHAEHLMIASIARYHRKSLPKKRHDAWSIFESKVHRRIVSEMSLLLRMSAALHRRPSPVIASLRFLSTPSELTIYLIPEDPNQNLGLECWSLRNCIPIVEALTGVKLTVLIDSLGHKDVQIINKFFK